MGRQSAQRVNNSKHVYIYQLNVLHVHLYMSSDFLIFPIYNVSKSHLDGHESASSAGLNCLDVLIM